MRCALVVEQSFFGSSRMVQLFNFVILNNQNMIYIDDPRKNDFTKIYNENRKINC